jgi:predicted enzyme related to lactoylglutathione lyase
MERLGGSALSPVIDIPSVGRMRTMRDPQGAAFCLLQPSSPERTPEVQPEIGDVAWHELFTTDSAAAMTFYTGMFGWTRTSDFDMGPMGTYRMFGRTFALGGMMDKPAHMAQVPPHWGLYFRVADLDAAVERMKTAGGQVVNGPMEVPGGARIANCLDPQGAYFSLHALPKA